MELIIHLSSQKEKKHEPLKTSFNPLREKCKLLKLFFAIILMYDTNNKNFTCLSNVGNKHIEQSNRHI